MSRVAPVCALLAGAALALGGGACRGDNKPAATVTTAATAAAGAAVSASAATDAAGSAAAQASGAVAAATSAGNATPTARAAVGGSAAPRQTATAAGARLDPCALVTKEDAEVALGAPAAAPLVQQTSLLAQCQYGLAATAGALSAAVTVQVFPPGSTNWKLRKETFARTKTVQGVAGVGEDAFWVENEGALFVLNKGVVFAIRLSGRPPASALAAAKALAQKAAGRM